MPTIRQQQIQILHSATSQNDALVAPFTIVLPDKHNKRMVPRVLYLRLADLLFLLLGGVIMIQGILCVIVAIALVIVVILLAAR